MTDSRLQKFGIRSLFRVHVAALLIIVVAACSPSPQPAVISVSVTAPAEIMVGQTAQADVDVEVANGASEDVVWSSSDEAVAIVSPGGLIGALAVGNVIITATSQHDPTKSDSVSVTVSPQPAVLSVRVTAPLEIIAGRTAQVGADVEAVHGAGDEVFWSSSDESIATVSSEGLITALADGIVSITATSQFDTTKSDSVSVAVLNPLREATVLYYRDFLHGTDAALGALTEAADLYGAVVVETDNANFVTELGSGAHDLVVVLRQGSSEIPDDAEAALLDWVDNGGALVFTSYNYFGSDVVAMLAAMEAVPTGSENFSSMEIDSPAMADGLAATSMPIMDQGWVTFSFGLQATGNGVELAHFYDSNSELTTEAALVSGNEGRTMALGFLVDTVGGPDGQRLFRNVFEYTLLSALP